MRGCWSRLILLSCLTSEWWQPVTTEELLIGLAKVADINVQHTTMAMVKHPDEDDLFLGLQYNRIVTVYSDGSRVVLSAGSGEVTGTLSETKLNDPKDITKIGNGLYAITDHGNEQVVKLDWKSKTTSVLIDEDNHCNDDDFKEPWYLAVDWKIKALFVTYDKNKILKFDLTENTCDHTQEVNAIKKILGIASSPYYPDLYILSSKAEGDELALRKLDTTRNAILQYDSFEVTDDEEDISNGEMLSDSPPKLYYDDGWSVIRMVGSHLIALLDRALFDFDLETGEVTRVDVPFTSYDPLLYFDDNMSPDFMYIKSANNLHKFSIGGCDRRMSTRPSDYHSYWLRKGGYDCMSMSIYGIGSDISTVPTLNGSVCTTPQTCYSICKAACEDDNSCVAFRCDTSSQTCRLSSCARLSTIPALNIACYRLADVVYAPPF